MTKMKFKFDLNLNLQIIFLVAAGTGQNDLDLSREPGATFAIRVCKLGHALGPSTFNSIVN